MKKKIQTLMRRMTIARMLWSLVIMGIAVIAGLAATSLWSNHRLVESQRRLTEIVVPMERASHALRETVTRFIGRKYRIAQAQSLEQIDAMGEAAGFKSGFTRAIDALKTLSQREPEAGGEAAVDFQALAALLEEALAIDDRVRQSAGDRIRRRSEIREKMILLDVLHRNLQRDVETFSDQWADAEAAGGTAPDLGAMRLDIAALMNQGQRMLLTDEAGRIDALVEERLQPAMERVADRLGRLRDQLRDQSRDQSRDQLRDQSLDPLRDLPGAAPAPGPAGGAASPELLAAISDAFSRIRAILTDGEQPLSALGKEAIRLEDEMARYGKRVEELTEALNAQLDAVQRRADALRNRAEAAAERMGDVWKLIVLVSLLAAFVIFFMGRRIHYRIMVPIGRVMAFVEGVAEGDLTVEIEKSHDDEIGLLINKLSEMAHSLNALIGQVQRSGIQVTSSATELSATSKQQEAVMKTQTESTNNVVQSIGEISSISEELVETMRKVAEMSEQTADYANSGQANLSQMEAAMHHMENASKSISGKLEAISEKAANITSVVTTITKVADQTNLLSLNAAIEAEKAGEYGRGFTVVAREIRRLADQTAVATLDIDQMVQEMQSAVSAGVMEMDAFIAEVQRSADNVGKISTQLTRIIEQVKSLTPSFEGVNESMQFQSDNAQKINAAMVSLSEEMQQTVESLQESFMAIEQLNDAARGLQDEVSRFKVA